MFDVLGVEVAKANLLEPLAEDENQIPGIGEDDVGANACT